MLVNVKEIAAPDLPAEQEAGFQAGVDGYLTKPINRQELQELLTQVTKKPLAH